MNREPISKSERREQPPLGAIDQYEEMQPILLHVRVMERVMDAVDDDPEMRPFHATLHCLYMDIVNEVIGEHALELALALIQLEEAYPEIGSMRRSPDAQE